VHSQTELWKRGREKGISNVNQKADVQ